MADRKIGQGTKVEFSTDGGTSKTVVGQIQTIGMPGSATELVDVTVIGDLIKQWVGSRQRDFTDFTIGILWDPNDSDAEAMRALEALGSPVDWYITIKAGLTPGDDTEIKFKGVYYATAGASFGAAEALTMTGTVKPTSDFTITSPPPTPV